MTGPLRVAVIARSVFPLHGYGGLERHVHDLVRHLARSGVSVTLITRQLQGPALADRTPGGTCDPWPDAVQVRYVPYRTFPLAGRRWTTVLDRSTAYPIFGLRAGRLAADLARRHEVDIVHGLGASALGYALAREEAGAPLVLNPQGLEEFGATDPRRAGLKRLAYLPLRLAVRRTARAADRVIATDRVLEPAVLQHLNVPRDRVRVVPNAIDIETIDAMAEAGGAARVREAARIAPSDVVLLSVGRLEQNKGFHVLVQALSALLAHGGDLPARPWRWVLAGEGPWRSRIEQTVLAAGLGDRVRLTGRLSDADLHAWYEAATLFVHPTLYEGSSLVTLEAMAHYLPVVGTTAGG
ncbi:MAG TPA: glycosyltransferase family 4 protein, partial [Vicinamibacterales bacterium]|nr:glycosyltransferase family 4 protein [Vicinamibacterales bacterium]